MPLTLPTGDVTHVTQLAIAAVFLLTAGGTMLNVLVSRLGRAVDRRRILVAALPALDAVLAGEVHRQLDYVERRVRLIYTAIFLAVMTALGICLLIALAFLDALIAADLAQTVAILLMLAMLALIRRLALLLPEVHP